MVVNLVVNCILRNWESDDSCSGCSCLVLTVVLLTFYMTLPLLLPPCISRQYASIVPFVGSARVNRRGLPADP